MIAGFGSKILISSILLIEINIEESHSTILIGIISIRVVNDFLYIYSRKFVKTLVLAGNFMSRILCTDLNKTCILIFFGISCQRNNININ